MFLGGPSLFSPHKFKPSSETSAEGTGAPPAQELMATQPSTGKAIAKRLPGALSRKAWGDKMLAEAMQTPMSPELRKHLKTPQKTPTSSDITSSIVAGRTAPDDPVADSAMRKPA
jgi:hypothetical protein